MKKQKNTNGITLIALVITIIVLLILAGVVLNLTLGENGILKKAEQAGEQYKISEILEKLELEKSNLITAKEGELPTVKEYIDHLTGNKIINDAAVTNIDDETKNILIDGYIFLVEQGDNKNIKITYQSKADGKPRIAKIRIVEVQPNSITIKVVASQIQEGTYSYAIKNVTAGEENYTTKAVNTSENQYRFEGLTLENKYMIQVKVENSNGTDEKETEEIYTKRIEVTSLKLNKEATNIKERNSETLTVTVLPANANNRNVKWTSSNQEVATVNENGVITAIKEGSTIITAISDDNNEIIATCKVTVFKPQPVYIYKDGVVNTELGGLTEFKQVNGIPKIQYFENYIEVSNSYKSQYSRNGGIGTANMIDVTDYASLIVNYEGLNSATWFLTNSSPLNVTSNVTSKNEESVESTVMDISKFSGNYYIGMWVKIGTTVKIKSILLQPK